MLRVGGNLDNSWIGNVHGSGEGVCHSDSLRWGCQGHSELQYGAMFQGGHRHGEFPSHVENFQDCHTHTT